MFYTFFRSAPEEGLCCKPKYRANLFKYILLVLPILFFVTSAVRISLPSVFCILDQIGLGKLWIKQHYMDVGIFNITRLKLEDTSN